MSPGVSPSSSILSEQSFLQAQQTSPQQETDNQLRNPTSCTGVKILVPNTGRSTNFTCSRSGINVYNTQHLDIISASMLDFKHQPLLSVVQISVFSPSMRWFILLSTTFSNEDKTIKRYDYLYLKMFRSNTLEVVNVWIYLPQMLLNLVGYVICIWKKNYKAGRLCRLFELFLICVYFVILFLQFLCLLCFLFSLCCVSCV